ncbi:MAG: hypothetical protein AAF280_10585 [Pseudomonadota bacterium]
MIGKYTISKYTMLLGCAAVLAGCAGAPEGTSQDNVSDFLVAAATIGCEIKHDSDYAPIEFQAGISKDQALGIAQFLLARGDALPLEGGGLRVTAGPCAQTA